MYIKYEFSTNGTMGALFFIFNDITKKKKKEEFKANRR